ncbi:MAG: sugar ABC transporter substrate-binding protein [Spirochaetaceae bacterium]
MKMKNLLIYLLITVTTLPSMAIEIDWRKVSTLQGQKFLDYVAELDLHGEEALDFWKKIPISRANRQVSSIYRKEAFDIYISKYPTQKGITESFETGMGTNITGPMSKQSLKLPFTDLYPMNKGTIGDPNKTYKIGYTIHGFAHPWLLNNADSAIWEANRHSNVELTILDPEFDNDKQVKQIDQWIKDKYDGILIWPMQEAPTGPPVNRAVAAGIPIVSVDRLVGSRSISAQVTGNFPANGTQQGMYLIHKLLQETGKVEANVLLIRKPLGSTADSLRTGHFLKVISYFPGINIVESYHNSSSRDDSYKQVTAALEKNRDIDVIFCTGAEQSMGAVKAIDNKNMWKSRKNGENIIILNNDDLFEALKEVKAGKIAMTSPYTPLLGALGIRVLLKIIDGESIPKNIVTKDIPMITKEKENIFGIETISVDEWIPYSYGRN